MKAQNKKWLSGYVFFNDNNIYSIVSDNIILNIISPFVQKCIENNWIDKYFFIRYSENGPHVRIRFFGDENILHETVKPEFELVVKGFEFKKEFKLRENPIEWVDYEPEIERYGGENAIPVAEECFFVSSKATIESLEKINDHSDRLGKGLLHMVIMVNCFFPEKHQATRFCENYHKGYLTGVASNEELKNFYVDSFKNGFDRQSEKLKEFIARFWEMLHDNDELPVNLDVFRNSIFSIKEKLLVLNRQGLLIDDQTDEPLFESKIYRILPSYVHMMNNRLGISIPEESYLAYLFSQSLN